MTMEHSCFFLMFALASYCACEELTFFEERIHPTLSSSGPEVTIDLSWDAALCPGGYPPKWYIVKFCSDKDLCRVTTKSQRDGASFSHGRPIPLAFFNTYTVGISYPCGVDGAFEWSRREIFTGPGELMPARGVAAEGGNREVTLTWQKPSDEITVFGDYVEITVCHGAPKVCLKTHRSPYGPIQGKYSIIQLSAGVEYTAEISVCKDYQGSTYRSKPVSVTFTTDSADESSYPPVDDFAVNLLKKSEYVDLELSYTKPNCPSGAQFIGVRIDIIDRANASVVDGLRSNDTKITIDNLPYFAHFTVKIKALYDDAEDVIASAEVAEVVGTGNEVLPDKPQILEVMSISNSSALIRWSHAAHKSVEFSYEIVLNDKVTLEIETLNANYTVINQNLEPDAFYNVTFMVLLSYNGTTTKLSSEQKQFKMLPPDALVPKFSVEDIQGPYMHLKWDVTLPRGTSRCLITVNHCQDAKNCIRTIISNMTDRTEQLEIEPFERYNITMTTTCEFVPDIVVSGVSETINIRAASRPPAVLELNGDSPDEGTLNIFWAPGPWYTRGYQVNYSVASENSWKQKNTSEPRCGISGLESSTSYNVSVAAYSMNGDEVLPGPSTSKLFQTLDHVPPKVENLVVSQVSFTRTIRISWTAPLYGKGHLSFRVLTKCRSPLEFLTNDTSFEFKTEEAPSSSTRCEVWVRSVNHESAYSEEVHAEIPLQTLPSPVGAEAVFLSDGKYLIRISPPKVEGVKEFEYQVSSTGAFVDRYQKHEITVEDDRFDTEVFYAVRVCVNDLCGGTQNFSFTTNTGPPDRVSSMSVELVDEISFEISWSKPERRNGPIDGYFVNITERGDRAKVVSSQETANETSFTFDGNEHTIYDVSVQAFNYDKLDQAILKLGEPEVKWIETDGIVPRPPSGVSTSLVQGQKAIQWQTDEKFNVARHKITATEVATQNQTILYKTTPVFVLSELKPYTQYVLRIASCIDAAGYVCGQPTSIEETTDVGHPSIVNVQLVNQNSTHVLFRWSEPEEKLGPIDGYEIAYIKAGDGLSPSNWTSAGNDRSGAIDFRGENTDYKVYVRAYNIDFGNQKLYSPVAVLECTAPAAKGSASIAMVVAAVSTGVVCLAVLAFIGFRKFNTTVYKIL